jgi:hypothetical protein
MQTYIMAFAGEVEAQLYVTQVWSQTHNRQLSERIERAFRTKSHEMDQF